MISMQRRFLFAAVVGALALMPSAAHVRPSSAQHAGIVALEGRVATVARGLDHPKGVVVAPNGDLFVAESGHSDGTCPAPNSTAQNVGLTSAGSTGAVARVRLRAAAAGTVTPYLSGLRSVCDGGVFLIGPSGLAMVGQDLYVAQGQSLCDVGQPISTCIVSQPLLRVRPGGQEAQIAIHVLTSSGALFPNGHADDYGIAQGPDHNLYVSDGGDNAVWTTRPDGTSLQIVTRRFAHFAHDPTITGVAFGKDGALYVTVFGAFPFLKGSGKVVRVTPDGRIHDVLQGLIMPIGVGFDAAGTMYVLQYANTLIPTPAPHFAPRTGVLYRRTAAGVLQPVVTGLTEPTAFTFGPQGQIYITNKGGGTAAAATGEVVEATLTAHHS